MGETSALITQERDTQRMEKMLDKPKLVKTLLRTVEVKEGDDVTLTCKFRGESLIVKWSQNDIDIESNEEVTITTTIDGNKGQSILECRSTPMSLAGKFSCQISNPVGHVQTTSLITVLPGIPTLKGFKLSKPVAPSVAKPLMNIDDVAEHK